MRKRKMFVAIELKRNMWPLIPELSEQLCVFLFHPSLSVSDK